jgi:hypothetical protein
MLASPVYPLHAQTLVPAGEARVEYGYAGTRVPIWSGGVLLPIQNNGSQSPVIHFIDDTGKEGEPFTFSIPGTGNIMIADVSRGPDGTYALCGWTLYDREGRGRDGFISWIPPSRRDVTTVWPYPYHAQQIAIAPDGTTWTQGSDIVYGADWTGSQNGVIRRFDKSGKQIGSWIPRNSILREVPDSFGLSQGKLAVNKDRAGWYASVAHMYFELTFDGDKISKPVSYPGIAPPKDDTLATGLAIMDTGDVYLTVYRYTAEPDLMYRLDRTNSSWVALPNPVNPDGKLNSQPLILGGDGKRLALFGGPESVIFLKPGD